MLIVHFKTHNSKKNPPSIQRPLVWDKLSMNLFLRHNSYKTEALIPVWAPTWCDKPVCAQWKWDAAEADMSAGRLVPGQLVSRVSERSWLPVCPAALRTWCLHSVGGGQLVHGQTDRQRGLLLAPLIYMGFIERPRNSWFLPTCLRPHHIF